MKKNIIILLLLVILFVPAISVNAQTLNEMYSELSTLQNKLNTANSSKKLTQGQINSLKNEIATTTANINRAKSEIVAAEKKISESETEIENKKAECDEMLRVLQLSSDDNTYIEYIMEADNYTDMVYRYAIVSQITDYNNGIMDELNKLIIELENKKVELNKKQKNLEKEQTSLRSKLATLNANLSELIEEGTDIKDDIAYLKKQIKYYENLGCSKTEQLSACKARHSYRSGGTTVNARGWTYPLNSGCVSSEYVGYGVRTDWSGPASGHHGIDLACNSEGTPVYPAAPGEVDRIVYHSSCGGNQVYIIHTVNGVKYTTSYLHLLSYAVKEHQQVTTSTVIGYVGGSSTRSYDACTTGAHLHFGIANGWHSVGFNAYSTNPRNIMNFPSIGGGYFRR